MARTDKYGTIETSVNPGNDCDICAYTDNCGISGVMMAKWCKENLKYDEYYSKKK